MELSFKGLKGKLLQTMGFIPNLKFSCDIAGAMLTE